MCPYAPLQFGRNVAVRMLGVTTSFILHTATQFYAVVHVHRTTQCCAK